MKLSKLATALVLALGLAGGASSVAAQAKGSVQSQLDSIKTEIASLRKAAASAPMLSQALQELSSKLAQLETELATKTRAVNSMPDAVERLDSLGEQVSSLKTEVAYLRTAIANVEQPAAVSGGGAAEHDQGMKLTTGDGRYSMTIWGYLQPRYELSLPEDFSTVNESGFALRRSRVGLRGQLGSRRVRYQSQIELAGDGAPLLDYFMDMRYREALTIRVGQSKVPFSRSYLAEASHRAFLELNETQSSSRYDRDMGVWALGNVLDGKLRYHAGISNGAGANQDNSNIDLAVAARVESPLLGEYIEAGYGDVAGSEDLRLTVGAAIVHDLVPSTQAALAIENSDVDGDGITDNVRVVSAIVDAQVRYKGWDLAVEGTWRHERWGSILDHDDNGDLRDAVDASSLGRRNYLGVTAEASYFVMPKRLLVGARASHGRISLLGLSGKGFDELPKAERALQLDGLVQLYREGVRRVGFMYSVVDYNAKTGADPADDIEHRFLLEAQLSL